MKWTYFMVLLAAVGGGAPLPAQTNLTAGARIPAPAVSPAPVAKPAAKPLAPRAATRIESDRGDFDLEARRATYHGHVRVDDPEMKLTSEWLIADLPPAGERVNHIVAETNVVIDFIDDKGQTNHATGAKAVYVYEVKDGMTNETVTLTGNAKVENAQVIWTGEPIVWNRSNNKISADHPNIIFRQSILSAPPDTNSPPAAAPPLAPH
jgi:lipopolysaccharide transport protein LptA